MKSESMESIELLTIRQAAERLALSTRTVWRRINAGVLPQPVYVGKKSPRLPAHVIERYARGGGDRR